MYRGEKPIETALAPHMVTGDDRPPCRRLLALHGGPATRREPRYGRPRRRHHLSYTPSNQIAKQKLYDKLKSMLNQLDMHDHLIPRNLYMKNEIDIGGVAHQAGTCRFGRDPNCSVLDANCKAHELDNLYVVDTSFFPSIGAVNPC